MDSTQRRVQGILLTAAIEAYGYNPYAPKPDDPDASCATCRHRQDAHTGEEWEGPCGADDCTCEGFVLVEGADRDD